MIAPSLILLVVFLAALFALALPTGGFLARAMEGALPRQAGFEAYFCRLLRLDPAEQSWTGYARSLLFFNLFGFLATYALARLQPYLPWADGKGALRADTAFNAAISFTTNTNWQSFAGETSISNLTQMLAFAVQNFLSAATGLAVAIVLIRAFARERAARIGNFSLDLLRGTLFVLLPICLVYGLFLVQQGSPQTFARNLPFSTLEDGAAGSIPLGPVASQEAIKMLGTNGGGFFNANSAHPFENPTPLTNLVQILSIFLLPAALCATLGRLVGDLRQGRAIILAMTVLFVIAALAALWAEMRPSPALAAAGVQSGNSFPSGDALGDSSSGGNLEGKELRFGAGASTLFATVTTAASCGAVDAMHDSLLPLAGLVPLSLILLSEVVFGGVGAGLYGMLLFALLAVFLAGLMIGRTPEYLGKKIEAFEMKMTALAILAPPLLVLALAALGVATAAGRAAISNPGPHGFSQLIYAAASAANNNGSAFAGFAADTPFWNLLLGAAMALGRFLVIVPVLAIAGSLAAKKKLAASSGTLPTHGPLFIALLVALVLIFGALGFLPLLALGPIAEHLTLFP